MLGRTNTGGAGGTFLNFKVVGNPQPANPKENTIWVDTDVEITSWIFSAAEPAEPVAGMVWFPTGTFSTAEFNALKRNGIVVYPSEAKQYIDGSWVFKTASTYQNGEWVEWWNGALFDNGNQYELYTGGWWKNPNVRWSGTSYAPNIGTVDIDDTMYLDAKVVTVHPNGAYVSTKNTVNLSGFSKIKADIEASGQFAITLHHYADTSMNDNVLAIFAIPDIVYNGIMEGEIPAGVESCYISIGTYNSRNMTIKKVWLER